MRKSNSEGVKMEKPNRNIIGETKADHIYRIVKQDIIEGNLMPGEKLVVSRIAESHSISAIPVREAFNRLEAEGLITIRPHQGAYIKKIETELLKELYPIRALLEGYAVRLSTPLLKAKDLRCLRDLTKKMDEAIEVKKYSQMGRLNHEFHGILYRRCGNESLVKLIEELWQKTIVARIVFNLVPHRAPTSNLEHKKLVEAIIEKKARKAERLIVKQNEKTLELLVKHLENTNRIKKQENRKTDSA
ncbi:MAG: GntR family transcriptional regulator [Deltaproteobacteria bacterium]|nr:GntR family transcriptional regulator [Deltaproteobacteria bacterium]